MADENVVMFVAPIQRNMAERFDTLAVLAKRSRSAHLQYIIEEYVDRVAKIAEGKANE